MYLHQTRNYFDGDEEHGFDDVEMERIVASEILEKHAYLRLLLPDVK